MRLACSFSLEELCRPVSHTQLKEVGHTNINDRPSESSRANDTYEKTEDEEAAQDRMAETEGHDTR